MVRVLPLAAVLLATMAALTNARILPMRSKQVKVYSYVLPAGAEEIRDDINHSFACANRTDGFYVDIDNDCQIFHRCQDKARFSFICAERTVFSQMYQTCVHDGQLGYPCEDSTQYYPEGEDYEPTAEEAAQPEEMRPEQNSAPSEELESPQTPSKAVESVYVKEEAMMAPMDTVQGSDQPSEQTGAEEQMKDEPDQQQEEQHQVNADLFDSVEEDGDEPSENSAQEVLDEAEPSVSGVPSEPLSSSSPIEEEESNEVEVMDDPNPQAPSDPSPSFEPSDETPQEEVTHDEKGAEEDATEVQSTPVESEPSTPDEKEPQYEGDSLLNAVQMVEEMEPIVHDLAPESEALPQHSADMSQDPEVPVEALAVQEDNEILPVSSMTMTDMEAEPLTSAASSSDEADHSSSEVESVQQVNDLPSVPEATIANAADESSETIVNAGVDANEAEPETADVKPAESVDDNAVEMQATATNDQGPMESPAIVEEMVPLRPNDSAELPELIVSTEFHLDAVTQGPPIRRRKTFLFRADAVRAKV